MKEGQEGRRKEEKRKEKVLVSSTFGDTSCYIDHFILKSTYVESIEKTPVEFSFIYFLSSISFGCE